MSIWSTFASPGAPLTNLMTGVRLRFIFYTQKNHFWPKFQTQNNHSDPPPPPPPNHALVTNRLDYCNSIMYVLPQRQISKLQRLQNAAARLALDLGKFCHITPALLLTFKSIHVRSPPYISELINVKSESSYSFRSNNNTVLQYPQQKILATHDARSFASAALYLWNCPLLSETLLR